MRPNSTVITISETRCVRTNATTALPPLIRDPSPVTTAEPTVDTMKRKARPRTVAKDKNRERIQPQMPSGLGFTSQIVFIESCSSAKTPVPP